VSRDVRAPAENDGSRSENRGVALEIQIPDGWSTQVATRFTRDLTATSGSQSRVFRDKADAILIRDKC